VSRVLLYMAGAVVLWWGGEQVALEGWVKYALRFIVITIYAAYVWKVERPLEKD
jgi:hypothetical protein